MHKTDRLRRSESPPSPLPGRRCCPPTTSSPLCFGCVLGDLSSRISPQPYDPSPCFNCLCVGAACRMCVPVSQAVCAPGRSLRNQIFFLVKDRPQGPPQGTTNRQPPTPTQPPTATNRQPPTANRQPPPTAPNHRLPTANRQSPPTANRQPPPTMVEHMECPRAFLPKLCNGKLFFSR